MKQQYRFRLPLDLQLFADDQAVDAAEEEFADLPDEIEEIVETPLDEEDAEVVDPQEKPKQSPEMDRAFADLRREKEAAERKAAAADQWAKENYGHLGVNTWEDYQNELAEQKKRDEYAERGIDYDEVRKIAKEEAQNHPTVKQAEVIAQRNSVNAEIRTLKSAYPDVDISEVEDLGELSAVLQKLPNWDDIQKKLVKGYELKDAYELANRETIVGKTAEAAAAAARTKARSKDHLKPSGTQAAGEAIVITPEEMALFRKTGTKKTDAEIIAWKKKQMANK